MSKEYINQDYKYEWECSNGHNFKKSWNKIQHRNQWCNICSSNITEEMCRFIFEQLTRKQFPKTRKLCPPYEIDGYCKELNIAFEYNGEQHYKKIKIFHKNGRSLKQQKQRDEYIKNYCKEKEIELIIIPCKKAKSKEDIESFIRSKIDSKEIINWDTFGFQNEKLQEIKDIVKRKNGILLNKSYIGYYGKNQICCENGHYFERDIEHLRRNQWCPYCSNQKVCKDNCLSNNFPDLIKEWDFEKNKKSPDEFVFGSGKKAWWHCLKCHHKWETQINCRTIRNYGCPKCARENRKLKRK